MFSELRIVLVIFVIVFFSVGGGETVVEQCREVFQSLTDCLNYATGKAGRPTKECCSSVANIDTVCLCYVIQLIHANSNPQFQSMGVKVSRLRLLPSACNLSNATSIDCTTPPISFNFNGFNNTDGGAISYERAYVINNIIQLNQANLQTMASMGRATYAQPMQLWDQATRKFADFTTNFSFVIDSNGSTFYGGGLAFFLAPEGSRIPSTRTTGGLGLTRENQELNVTDNSFVAVEFDISPDQWDPLHDHVGIDIKSLESVANVSWCSGISDGRLNEASISYVSSSKNLSVAFTNCTNLRSFYYAVNLSEHLPERVIFGFSATTEYMSMSLSIRSWGFSSTLEIDQNFNDSADAPGQGPTVVAPPNINDDLDPTNKNNNMRLVLGLVLGGTLFVLVGGLGFVVFARWRKMNNRGNPEDVDYAVSEDSMDDEFERGIGPKKFSYQELFMATNNFSQQEKLGEGGFGGVYRGFLRESNSFVAVKRVSRESKQGIKEYTSEVKTISRLRHKNLVQLIGWCHERREELILVYEFMENGSLDFHLFNGKSLLAWGLRYKIALGIASALLYLHEEWEQCVVHRDIKSSNVMLDSDFNAKLGDFGLARFVAHDKGSQTTVLAGTMGYMAPECVITGQASRESDVYSFGVVALEIACGRKPIDPKEQKNKIVMVEWVWDLYGKGMLLEAADPKLYADFDELEMKRLMTVGLWCVHPDNNYRPSIRHAIHVLNSEALLPILPAKMPVPTYDAPHVNKHSSQSLAHEDVIVSDSSQAQYWSYSNNTDSSNLTSSLKASSPSALLFYTT